MVWKEKTTVIFSVLWFCDFLVGGGIPLVGRGRWKEGAPICRQLGSRERVIVKVLYDCWHVLNLVGS